MFTSKLKAAAIALTLGGSVLGGAGVLALPFSDDPETQSGSHRSRVAQPYLQGGRGLGGGKGPIRAAAAISGERMERKIREEYFQQHARLEQGMEC